jgi:hypothetical protein
MKEIPMDLAVRSFSGVVAVVAIGACDSGGLTSTESGAAFVIATSTLGAAAESGQESKSDTVSWSIDYACPAGGKITASGTYDSGGSDLDLSATYSACKVGNLSMGGSLHWIVSVAQQTDTTTLTSSFDGTITFSGTYNGACAIDVGLSVTTTPTSVNGSYSGTVCGFGADSTLSFSASTS